MSYQWKVPVMPTKTGRIRIFQTTIAQPDTVTSDYTLVSGNFSIIQKTNIADNRIMPPVINSGRNSGAIFTLSGRKVKGNATLVKKHLRIVHMRQL